MVRYSSGVICVALPPVQLDRLNLRLMVARNTESIATAYTITTDYKHGTSTGISASVRAATLRGLVDPRAQPDDFNRPGHVFPLCARLGGVLARAGHTETAVDLTRLAGLKPGGALSKILTSSPPLAFGHRLRGKDGDSCGATHA